MAKRNLCIQCRQGSRYRAPCIGYVNLHGRVYELDKGKNAVVLLPRQHQQIAFGFQVETHSNLHVGSTVAMLRAMVVLRKITFGR